MYALDREAFRQHCRKQGITLTDLAERIHVDRNTLGRWLNGSVMPALDNGMALAHELDTTVDMLWTRRPRRRSAR